MKRAPTTIEGLASALSPEARRRLASIQRDTRAAQALSGADRPQGAPRRAAAPSTVVPSVSVRGPVVVLQLKGLVLASAPNTREHWTARAERSRAVRDLVGGALDGTAAPAGPWTVALTRSGPRPLDTDNLAASFKALRDAIAAWLGVDDGPAGPVRWEYGQTRGGYGATAVVSGR